MTASRPVYLHVFATFGAGGPQVRAVQILGRLGAAVRHVVVAMDGCTDARAQLPPGLDVEFAPPPPRGSLRATVARQVAFLRERRPDLLLTYNWGAIESAWAGKRLGLPRVHHEDGFLPDEATTRLRRRNWLRWWVLRGVPVIVPSRGLAAIAQREWGLPVLRVHHLVNGVDLQRFQPGPPPVGPFTVVTVGGLRPEKDQATLLRALVQTPTVHAEIVGGGPLAAALQAEAVALGLGNRITFTGPVTDTASCYRRAHAFVLSSRTEQMPLVLLEAMASGLPIAATDVGDVRTILPEPNRLFVVPRQDPTALAQALTTLAADADLRQRLGAANRAEAERHYAAATCLDRFVAVYQAALGR